MPLAVTLLEAEEWKWDIFTYPARPISQRPDPERSPQGSSDVRRGAHRLAVDLCRPACPYERSALAILPLALIGFERVLLLPYWVVDTSAYAYFPGMVTTFVLLRPASFALVRRAWRDGLVSRRYLVTLAAILLLDIGNWVIRLEAALTEKMLAIDRFGTALDHLVGR